MWSRVDEAQHADFVARLAQGSYPVEGRTSIRQETLDLMAATGVFRWNAPGDAPVPELRRVSSFTPVPAYLRGHSRRLWIERHIWSFSYEAMQPPLFYAAAVPFWTAGERVAGTRGGVYAVRVQNALLLALLGPLTLLLARTALPENRRIWWLATGLVALLPGLVLNGTQVTNDTAAAVLGTAALLTALRGRAAGWPTRLALLTGALIGAAAMAKLTAAGLALPVAAAFLGRRPRWGAAVPAAAAALLIAAPWVALNLHLYGQILPSDATRQLLGAVFPSRPGAAALAASLKNAFTTFWAGEPHRELPVPELTTSLMALWLAAAAVGAWRLRRPPRVFGLLLLAVVGEIGWAIATLSFSGVGGAIPGRYLYPAAPAICVLAAAGIGEVLRNASLQVVAFGLYSAAAAINLGGLPLGFTGLPAPDRTAPSPGSTAYAVSAAAGFAGVTVAADRVLADSTQGCIWIHLSAVNRSGGPVDWWPVLYLHVGGSKHAVESSYGRSTAFPDTLDPGERVTGWVEAPVSPAELRRPVDAYMVDIAADGYRRVGEVKLVLAA